MNRKKKIAIFHGAFIYTGGGERIVLGQLQRLRKKGYQVECWTALLDKKKCYPDIIGRFRIKTFLPPLPKWFPFRIGLMLLLTSMLAPFLSWRFKKFDLFIGENQPGAWLAFAISRILRKPYLVYTCHPNKMVYPRRLSREQLWKNQRDFYWLSLFFIPFKKLLKTFDYWSFCRSDGPVLVNGFSIARKFGQIYHTQWFSCPSGAPFLKHKKSIISNNNVYTGNLKIGRMMIKKPYLLYVGRHEVWKRIDLNLKIFKNVLEQYPDLRLVIRGPFSSHTEFLKNLASKLGIEKKVIFSPEKGSQPELKQFLFNALALSFTTKKEDFGIAIIEAMGAGVPVVAWNSGGPKDIIVDNKTGFLAKPYVLTDFSNKILQIVKNPGLRKKMSLASWQRVKDNFSWQKHGEILDKEIKRAGRH